MPTAAQVTVASEEQRRVVQLVAAYAGVTDQVQLVDGPELGLRAADGSWPALTQLNTICRALAERSSRKAELVGGDEQSRAQISEWLSFRNVALSPITEEQLGKVNSHLLTRIFLVGSAISLADLILFAALHTPLANLPVSQVPRFCNLFRWAAHLQHCLGPASPFPPLAFPLPPLPQPPALAPAKAAAPAAAAAAKDASAAKQQQQQQAGGKGRAAPAAAASKPAEAAAAAPASGKPPAAAAPPKAAKAAASGAEGTAAKQAKKEARRAALGQAAAPAEAPKKAEEEVRIDMLDIRVGQVLEVAEHPNADTLYVSQIDLGEGQPRQVVSGLRNFVPREQLQGRRVVVCTNLKPAKMRDVLSSGMVLCASTPAHDKVDPLTPPQGAALGARVCVAGYANEPLGEINPKKKIFERLKEHLQTDSIGVATYKSIPFLCGGAPVTSGLPNGNVS